MNRLGLLTLALSALTCSCRESSDEHAFRAKRVVSLAPSLTEVVFAVGAGSNMVGRTSACDFPPESSAVPVIGDFGVPSMERLASAKPTLVLELALSDEAMGSRMDRLGLNRRRIPCNRLKDIPPAIREVGLLTDCTTQAETLARAIDEQVARLRSSSDHSARKPKVFVEVWHDPITTAGKESFVADLIELAGGDNIGNCVATPYYTVSSEWIISRNPDVILALYMSSGSNAPPLSARAGWSGIEAVRRGHVYGGLNNDVVLRPGPRVIEGVELIRQCLQSAQSR